MSRRIKITLAYDGTGFHGWQVQPGLLTIQGAIEAVLLEIEGKAVPVAGSGRTDAGVHALAQVAAFSLDNPIPLANLHKAMNRLMPADIRVLAVEEVGPEFHPRHNAIAKTYEYRIWRGEVCSPFDRRWVHHHPYPLDVHAMQALAPLFEGMRDFSAFAAADDSDQLGRSKVRTIFCSQIELAGERLYYRVRGNGFLKHMVRNIVGTLLECGKNNLDEPALRRLLEEPGAVKAGPTAPACGLFLIDVEYR
jgi:tRNA pseudouridine38-40 synthase